MTNKTIYDQLSGTLLSSATTANLNTGSNLTYVDKKSIQYWRDVLTVSKAIEASRTYASGNVPIPEVSNVEVVTVADGASGTLTPGATEVYLIQNISTTQDVVLSFLDDDGHQSNIGTITSSAPYKPTSPIMITKSMKFGFTNGSGSSANISVAYHKLSL